MNSPSIEKLIKIFARFPGIGPKASARLVYNILSLSPEESREMANLIKKIKSDIYNCEKCFAYFEPKNKEKICSLCLDKDRDKRYLMVVEKETDFEAIEKTGKFKGYYFIMGGVISKMEDLKRERNFIKKRNSELIERLKNSAIEEIILALNPTPEGEATSRWIEAEIKNSPRIEGVKITHLGKGLPVGGELEYTDEETLAFALRRRE